MDFVSLLRTTTGSAAFEKVEVSDFIDLEQATGRRAPLPPISWFRKSAGPTSLVGHLAVGGIDIHLVALPPSVFVSRRGGAGRVLVVHVDDNGTGAINGQTHSGPVISIGSHASRFFGHRQNLDNRLQAGVAVVVPEDLVSPVWPKPISVFTAVHVDPGAMATVKTVLVHLVDLAQRRPERLRDPGVVRELRGDLLAGFDEALTSPRSIVAHRDVQLCDRFEAIMTKIDEVFPHKEALEELVDALAVSEKSLYNTIKQASGLTPYNLIRIKRLIAVRRSILTSPPGVLIKQHAIDSGYWHLGRFAGEYALYFGETPSETLRRRGREVGVADFSD